MTEVRFYHLVRRTLDQALPRLLEKSVERGWRTLVVAGSPERVDALDQHLWTYNPASFLPHGTEKSGYADRQPIFITCQSENPNAATVVMLTDGMEYDDLSGFALVCDLFDGNDDDAVAAARQRWKRCKDAGHTLTYWQQTDAGGWEKKA